MECYEKEYVFIFNFDETEKKNDLEKIIFVPRIEKISFILEKYKTLIIVCFQLAD